MTCPVCVRYIGPMEKIQRDETYKGVTVVVDSYRCPLCHETWETSDMFDANLTRMYAALDTAGIPRNTD